MFYTYLECIYMLLVDLHTKTDTIRCIDSDVWHVFRGSIPLPPPQYTCIIGENLIND